jgi:hypothetical protein
MGVPSCVDGITPKRINPKDGSILRVQARLPPDSALDAYTVWGSIAQAYSEGALTQGTDGLIAMAGMAAQMQPILDHRYLAGMWQRHLAISLTWSVSHMDKRTKPKAYIAP